MDTASSLCAQTSRILALLVAGGCLSACLGGNGSADGGIDSNRRDPIASEGDSAMAGGEPPAQDPDSGKNVERDPSLRDAGSGMAARDPITDAAANTGDPPAMTAPSGLSGTIVFEQAHDYGFIDHQGISTYDIAGDQVKVLAHGIYPRRHPTSGETAFLQECADIAGDGVYYRVAIANEQGLSSPVTPCSLEIPNPTTGVFLLDDRTQFGLVSLSPDASKVSVTLWYDLLSDDQSHVVGEAINTAIYDRSGQLLAEIDNAYDAAWLPDGRLLYAFGNQFFVTDAAFGSSAAIIDGDVLDSGVNNPAVHPSGEYFVFEHGLGLWRMSIDGSGLSRIVALDRWLRHPTWSPDGTKLLFTVWSGETVQSALKSFFVIDVERDESHRIDIEQHLATLAEPWGPLSWVR